MKKYILFSIILALSLNPILHAQVVQTYVDDTNRNTTVYEKVEGTTDSAVLNEIDRNSIGFGEVVQIQNYVPQNMNTKPIEQRISAVPSRATAEINSTIETTTKQETKPSASVLPQKVSIVSDTRWSDKLKAARARKAAKEANSNVILENPNLNVTHNTINVPQKPISFTQQSTSNTIKSSTSATSSTKRKSKKRVRMPRWKNDKRTKKTRSLRCFKF